MSQINRKARIQEYKKTPRPAGIYRVRNTATGRSLLGSSLNLPGMLNRQRFQLENGSHPDRELQSDWNKLGSDVFEFEILDQLELKDESEERMAEELHVLLAMWLDKLTSSGESLYRQSFRGT